MYIAFVIMLSLTSRDLVNRVTYVCVCLASCIARYIECIVLILTIYYDFNDLCLRLAEFVLQNYISLFRSQIISYLSSSFIMMTMSYYYVTSNSRVSIYRQDCHYPVFIATLIVTFRITK